MMDSGGDGYDGVILCWKLMDLRLDLRWGSQGHVHGARLLLDARVQWVGKER
jgi:hypothetical protein